MSEILISAAPFAFQSYLTHADTAGNSNGKIDSESEARAAAVEYRQSHGPEDMTDFLVYLQQSQYVLFDLFKQNMADQLPLTIKDCHVTELQDVLSDTNWPSFYASNGAMASIHGSSISAQYATTPGNPGMTIFPTMMPNNGFLKIDYSCMPKTGQTNTSASFTVKFYSPASGEKAFIASQIPNSALIPVPAAVSTINVVLSDNRVTYNFDNIKLIVSGQNAGQANGVLIHVPVVSFGLVYPSHLESSRNMTIWTDRRLPVLSDDLTGEKTYLDAENPNTTQFYRLKVE